MKLTWNILLKDLRRIWAPWTLWLALAIADIALGSRLLHGEGVNRATQFEIGEYRNAVRVLFLVLEYILAAWLVQLDAPVNPDSEWITLPIAGARVFASKLLGIALLLLAPLLLIDAIWWIESGLMVRQMPVLAVETLSLSATIAFGSMFLASLSRDWARLLLLTVAVLGLAIFAEASGLSLLGGFWGDSRAEEPFRSLEPELIWIVLAGIVAAALVQFTYRRIGRSCGIACIGMLLAGLVSQRFDVGGAFPEFSEDHSNPVPVNAEPLPKGIQISFERAQTFDDPVRPSTPYLRWNGLNWSRWPVSLSLKIEGTPVGEMFHREVFDGALDISGRIILHEHWSSFLDSNDFVAYVPRSLLGSKPGAVNFERGLLLKRSIAAKAVKGPTSLRGKFYLQRMVSKIGAELPLSTGSRQMFWGDAVTILHTTISGNDDERGFNNPWDVSSVVNIVGPSSINWNDRYSEGEIGGYVFWNRVSGEAVYASESTLARANVQGVRLERGVFSARIPFAKNIDTQEKAEQWIAGAELVWVGYTPKQFYWVPFEIPDLRISIGKVGSP